MKRPRRSLKDWKGENRMRDILFRGKRIDNGEWVEGDFVHLPHGVVILANGYANIDPETVGQYTGLKDKNGVKILEGDVVKKKDVLHHNEVQIKGEKYVIQNESGCWWGIQKMTDYKRAEFLSSFCCSCEVIGNIHDNPELLKEGGE